MSEIDVRLIDGQAEETVLNRIAEIEAGAYSFKIEGRMKSPL